MQTSRTHALRNDNLRLLAPVFAFLALNMDWPAIIHRITSNPLQPIRHFADPLLHVVHGKTYRCREQVMEASVYPSDVATTTKITSSHDNDVIFVIVWSFFTLDQSCLGARREGAMGHSPLWHFFPLRPLSTKSQMVTLLLTVFDDCGGL